MRILQSFAGRLKAFAMAAAIACELAPPVHASLITVTVNQTQVPGQVPFDPATLGGPDFFISDDPPFLQLLTASSVDYAAEHNSDSILDLAPGEVVGGRTLNLTSGSPELLPDFPLNQVDYLGFETYGDPGQFAFGYLTMEITLSQCGALDLQFFNFTYDDSGAPVIVKAFTPDVNDPQSSALRAGLLETPIATPEPGTYMTLLLGGVGLLGARGIRKALYGWL